jgi:nitroimidazol reductase NimA-like FMN-containing flavoprotein (pyridoxamine 5'-phosphate oxidase superfamily)
MATEWPQAGSTRAIPGPAGDGRRLSAAARFEARTGCAAHGPERLGQEFEVPPISIGEDSTPALAYHECVLYRRHDAPRSEEQWKAFLLEHRFGQLVAAGDGSEPPFVIPAHFSYDGDGTIRLHLHRDNPVWKALEQNPVAVMAVLDAYAFIPSYWNEPKPYGVATSFYAAVQAIGTCRFVDEPEELADLIGYQLRDLQPEGGQDRHSTPKSGRTCRCSNKFEASSSTSPMCGPSSSSAATSRPSAAAKSPIVSASAGRTWTW